MSGDICGCHNSEESAIGMSWAEARDMTKHPMLRKTAPHNKELSGPNISRAEVGGPINPRSWSASLRIWSIHQNNQCHPKRIPGNQPSAFSGAHICSHAKGASLLMSTRDTIWGWGTNASHTQRESVIWGHPLPSPLPTVNSHRRQFDSLLLRN